VTEQTQKRVRRLVQEILNNHVEVLLVLMAESGHPHPVQRIRMDSLVRTLQACTVEPALMDGGRAVPYVLEEASPASHLRFNGAMLQHIDDQEIMMALSRPIATMLDLSSVTVGLVVKERDERQLTALANQTARQVSQQVAKLTEIEAIVEARVNLFEERLYQLVYRLAERSMTQLSTTEQFIGQLIKRSSRWPDWMEVEPYDYITDAIRHCASALDGTEGLPGAATLVELVWESIGLSTESFLRIAARTLRSSGGAHRRSFTLRTVARVVHEEGEELSEELTTWSTFSELSAAWKELWKKEQELAGSRNANLDVPAVSVYDPPGEVMGLSEPESLPWQFPLLCWTVRERDALKDLIVGLAQALGKTQSSTAAPQIYLNILEAYDSPLKIHEGPFNVGLKPLAVDVAPPPNYDETLLRALTSAYMTTRVQYGTLDEGSRQRAFHLLLGGYTGYMPQAKPVWDRRFNKIKELERGEAFATLVTKLHHVLRLPILFDIFEEPDTDTAMLMPMPAFNLIAAFPEGVDQVPLYIPLGALKPALGTAPIRIRVIRVPSDPSQACTWLCDHALTLQELRTQSPDMMLRAVNNDILRMLVYY
jgi:hypothetical protein